MLASLNIESTCTRYKSAGESRPYLVMRRPRYTFNIDGIESYCAHVHIQLILMTTTTTAMLLMMTTMLMVIALLLLLLLPSMMRTIYRSWLEDQARVTGFQREFEVIFVHPWKVVQSVPARSLCKLYLCRILRKFQLTLRSS